MSNVQTDEEARQTDHSAHILEAVRHTTHVTTAISIFKDGKIAAEPTFEPRLQMVSGKFVWLTPNHWSPGSVFGHIIFVFPWTKVLRSLGAYDVGYAPEHGAHQILITERANIREINRYTPTKGGAWWHDAISGQHLRRTNESLHFIVDQDLPLDWATEIKVTNHLNNCVKFGNNCPDRLLNCQSAMATFMARALVEKAIDQVRFPRVVVANSKEEWCFCWEQIEKMVRHQVNYFSGTLSADQDGSAFAVLQLLTAVAHNDAQNVRLAGTDFRSAEDMVQSIKATVFPAFGLCEEDLTRFKQKWL